MVSAALFLFSWRLERFCTPLGTARALFASRVFSANLHLKGTVWCRCPRIASSITQPFSRACRRRKAFMMVLYLTATVSSPTHMLDILEASRSGSLDTCAKLLLFCGWRLQFVPREFKEPAWHEIQENLIMLAPIGAEVDKTSALVLPKPAGAYLCLLQLRSGNEHHVWCHLALGTWRLSRTCMHVTVRNPNIHQP